MPRAAPGATSPHAATGGQVDRNTFEIAADGFETLIVDDMGEECLVLSVRNDAGKVERVAVSRTQLVATINATAWRYGEPKNTDQLATAA